MNRDRRHVLGLIAAQLVLSSSALFPAPLAAARKRSANRPRAALLLPLSGASASVGLSMQRAAMLAQSPMAKPDELLLLDTAGTATGAAAAVSQALRGNARIIVGPVFADESRAAAGAAGAVPVLSFSNDEDLIGSGAFLLGITASQSVAAVLGYARSRGVRRVIVWGGSSRWSTQANAAAERLRGSAGLSVQVLPQGVTIDQLLVAMRRAGGGELPDALLVTEGGEPMRAAARLMTTSGVQLLGTQQALDLPAQELSGGWFAGPDPAGLSSLADRYRASGSSSPGLLAALANDAITIVERLRSGGVVDRPALLAQPFPLISGLLRFAADGSATRNLPILVAGANGYIRVNENGTL